MYAQEEAWQAEACCVQRAWLVALMSAMQGRSIIPEEVQH